MVANELGVSKEDVIEMESRMTGADVGFDLPTDDDDEAYVPSLYLEDKRDVYKRQSRKRRAALGTFCDDSPFG